MVDHSGAEERVSSSEIASIGEILKSGALTETAPPQHVGVAPCLL